LLFDLRQLAGELVFAFDHGIGLAITGGAGRLVAQLR